MMRSLFVITTAVLALLALGLARSARAAEDDDTRGARTHLRAGMTHYAEGRFDDALREMELAYKLRPVPELQFNIARCLERLGRPREAAAAYRRYVEGRPQAEDAQAVTARARDLERDTARPLASLPKPEPRVVEKEKIVFKEVLKQVIVYRDAPPRPGRGARIASGALGAVALGGLGTGIAFAVMARQNAGVVTRGGDPQAPPPFAGDAAEAQAEGRLDRAVSIASFVTAGLAAGGAVGLWLLGRHIDQEADRSDRSERGAERTGQAQLSPLVLPGGGGVLVTGRF